MGHEENQVHHEVNSDQNGNLPGATSIGTPQPGGPADRYRQQGELDVNEIAQEYARIELRRPTSTLL